VQGVRVEGLQFKVGKLKTYYSLIREFAKGTVDVSDVIRRRKLFASLPFAALYLSGRSKPYLLGI